MCGRFILTSHGKELAEHFGLMTESELSPRYNITPTQEVATIRRDPESNGKRLAYLKWGLVPFWAKDMSIGSSLINARCETLSQKPAFRASFKSRRLLIPANGFYEWKKTKEGNNLISSSWRIEACLRSLDCGIIGKVRKMSFWNRAPL